MSVQLNEAADFESGTGPLYAAVKQFVRSRIDSGAWPPNARVPSENELVSELGVSRMTANRALRELAAEGVIVRVQGVGSFVAKPRAASALFDVHNIAEEIRGRGGVHHAKVLVSQAEAAGPDLAYSMGMELGCAIFHSIIVHSENDIPIQIEDRFVVAAAAPAYLDQDYTLTTPNAYLTSVVPIDRMEQSVEAMLAQPWEGKLLAITPGEPCLLIRRRTWSVDEPVTSVRLLYPGSRYRLEASSRRS